MLNLLLWVIIVSSAVGFLIWIFGGNFRDGARQTAGCLFKVLALWFLIVITIAIAIVVYCLYKI